MSIKNIIFDLGGVVLNIDQNLTWEAFKRLGFEPTDDIYSYLKKEKIFEGFEIGEISAEDFCEAIRKCLPAVGNAEIIEAWNAMLLDLPEERVFFLTELSKRYKLFLLSNTNVIHYNAFSEIVYDAYGCRDLLHIFSKEYYSHQIGMRKPNREVFELLLKENALQAKETLFVDDTLEHVEGAKRMGINAYWIKGGKSILDVPLDGW